MVKCTPVPLPAIPGMPRTSLPTSASAPAAAAPPSGRDQQDVARAAVAPAPAPAAGSKRGTKRKSTDALGGDGAGADAGSEDNVKTLMFPEELEDIDNMDPRLAQYPRETCNQVRKKIRTWTESGAQKIGEFQRTIGVSGPSYNRFMNRTGTWDGAETDTYFKAALYFNKRKLLGLPLALPKPKKAKTAASGADAAAAKKAAEKLDAKVASLLDTCDDIQLPGEGTERGVPVFDTPSEIRKKIRALLAKEGVTKTGFLRALTKTIPNETPASAQNLKTFMNQTAVTDGNTSKIFYAAYLLFEKQRIRDGKPKSAFRLEMEEAHGPRGLDRRYNYKVTGFLCMANERPYFDKYGRLTVM